VQLDGAMPEWSRAGGGAIRPGRKRRCGILVATEVASEGLNLHYLSHGGLHFRYPLVVDDPAATHGRIDRYGQSPTTADPPTCSPSRAARGWVMPRRSCAGADPQGRPGQKNIGDPSVFLRAVRLPPLRRRRSAKRLRPVQPMRLSSAWMPMPGHFCEQASDLNPLREMFGRRRS